MMYFQSQCECLYFRDSSQEASLGSGLPGPASVHSALVSLSPSLLALEGVRGSWANYEGHLALWVPPCLHWLASGMRT